MVVNQQQATTKTELIKDVPTQWIILSKNIYSTSPQTKQPNTTYPYPLVIIIAFSISQIQQLQKKMFIMPFLNRKSQANSRNVIPNQKFRTKPTSKIGT